MTNKQKNEESLQFVARHFQDDTLLSRPGWRYFKLTHNLLKSRFTFSRSVAAACIGVIVLAASASIYFFALSSKDSAPEGNFSAPEPLPSVSFEEKSLRIEFQDATLKQVVAEIERAYGVTISNLPSEEMKITISYEGTAEDVVETINALLDINLTISPKTDLPSEE